MKKALVAAVLLVVVMGAGYVLLKKDNAVQKFRTEKVVKGDIIEAVTATGTVNAVTTVLVGTQVSGTVRQILADFNSPVKKNQLIAEIDPATFEAQVEQSRANVLNAMANKAKADATLADAERSFARNRELFGKGYIARNDLDSSETNFETSRAQVSAAKALLAQSEAALKISETNLRYTKILSPVDGVVISRNVDVGQTVAASFQTPTLFTIAQDLTKMQIDANVDESDIGRVSVGQDVEFTVDAYPDTTFKGKVSQVRNAPISVQNVVTYDVVIQVSNQELRLKPGMTTNVSIIISVKKDVLRVANAALRFKPAEREKGTGGKTSGKKGQAVWIVENDKPKRISISAGSNDGNFTEIASGELREGQEVIIEANSKERSKAASGPPRMF
ncbi:MAG: efflux RND transporter periplasmic adaptor subunit [Nitrospirae bacterium]|nr:MAG: efflux RND transporter periplasmic adaptor subunit [Nitrospirota bacterium]